MKRALLVGAGGMGQGWADNILKNERTELAGWVDVFPGKAAEEAQKRNLDIWTGENLEAAIAGTQPDFVVDVTIPEAHCEVTLTALAQGIPVLGEKPMASSMDEARQMVAASEASGKLYMVSQSRRYAGGVRAYRTLVQEELGRLGILNADFYIGAHFGGFRDEMPSPLVLDMAIHTFDAARYISGADPVSVYAEEFNPSWSWYKGDASATCLFEMSNGLRFTYRGSWCAEGLHSSWEGDWRAVGEHGTALWDGGAVVRGEVVGKTGSFFSECRPVTRAITEIPYGIASSLNEFLDALEGGPTPNGECHDNIKSLAMVFAAMQSSREGRRVAIAI
ncbi:MAG: Gfo/Idh/MocA family protein [Fimbriimonas sp.]